MTSDAGTRSPGLAVPTGRVTDVVSLGEVMLRLAPPRFARLRQARSLDVEVAGAQLNVVANLAQLGKRTAFLSKLPSNELGRLAEAACRGYGVDMRHVSWVSDARMGLNFLEFTSSPRVPVAIFDRTGSAASTIGPDDFDWAGILDGAAVAHTDGIFPGIGARTRDAAAAFLQTAKARGCLTSFDVNYREHVWTPDRARACWEELLPNVDVLVTSPGISELVFGFHGSDDEIAARYADAFGCSVVVVTRREVPSVAHGAWSCVGRFDGRTLRGTRHTFEVVDRYGTGDAFVAGLLHGILEGDVALGLELGNAACALAHTVEGDIACLRIDEVRQITGEEIDLRVRR